MTQPVLLPTNLQNETFAGLTYHIQGELVPALTIELLAGQSVYFEHHVLLWKNTTINIGIKSMSGMLKRMFAGMQLFVTEATGTGQISFSRDGTGHIVPIHLHQGEELQVREHQFLAASQHVDYSFERIQGFSNLVIGGNDFFLDKFRGNTGDGIVWIHGYGNVFEKILADSEQIDVEPTAWLYKDPTVKMDTVSQKVSTGILSSANFFMNRFTGPGRLGIQSMYYSPQQVNAK